MFGYFVIPNEIRRKMLMTVSDCTAGLAPSLSHNGSIPSLVGIISHGHRFPLHSEPKRQVKR